MKSWAVPFILVLGMAGCTTKSIPLPNTVSTDPIGVDAPFSLQRVYHMQLTNGRILRVTTTQTRFMNLFESGVEFSDELSQVDGAWVIFDCDKVADKILDRDLVPEVESGCKSIHSSAM